MRVDGFLRTPIRADHQARLRDLAIGETPLAGDPAPGTPYPQTLELSFEVAAGVTDVEIAPLWEALLRFLPDSTAGNPTSPGEVLESRFGTWSVSGDLVLQAYFTLLDSGHEQAFAKHLPSFTPAPTAVRYSKIRLTPEFLFTTLRQAPRDRFMLGGAQVATSDPSYHQKRVISFMSGSGRLRCLIDPADAAKDTALLPMPSVVLAPAGTRTVLRVALASLSEEMLSPTWFDQRPAYDDISGEQLVPLTLRNITDQLANPGHASHSVIPAWALLQAAPAAAFAPDQAAATTVRAALTAPRPDGRTYRRIALSRPTIPGPPVGSSPRRAYPGYRLCWRPTGGGPTESLRLPLSGVLYLPLADGTYRFWAIPRSADPATVLAGDHIRLSLPPVLPRRVGGPPQTTIDVPIAAAPEATIEAHLNRFDAAMAWEGYRAVAPRQAALQAKARTDWNVKADLDWIIPRSAARRPQSALYGLFRESAGRHGLSPEFLHVVFFGEAGGQALPTTGAWVPGAVLDAFGFIGLDLIVYRTGRLPVGRPPIPPEVPVGALEERAEFTFNLVTAGYVDPAVAADVTWVPPPVARTEAGFTRTLEVGSIAGWASAIELVAAELHARLDEMTAYVTANSLPVAVGDELTRRFLTYLRFNSRPTTAQEHARNLAARLARWTGPPPPPPGNQDVRFNALQRIAVAQWHDAAAAYREAQ